jgi:protein-S-isoprenylcysteine O-methyltransferase Ste14
MASTVIRRAWSRTVAPAEEATLSNTFGAAWAEYTRSVKIPWL